MMTSGARMTTTTTMMRSCFPAAPDATIAAPRAQVAGRRTLHVGLMTMMLLAPLLLLLLGRAHCLR